METGLKRDKIIKAILFDFGQTLADSAGGFRAAEKRVQKKIFKDIALTEWEEFLTNYRKIRTEFHAEFNLSRFNIWREITNDVRTISLTLSS